MFMAMDQEAQRLQLKKLIIRGKDQGYLTYREINDHLPEEVYDTDQIETVVNMINDMGIDVYDQTPDPETLLMKNEAANPDSDDDVEEAEQVVASAVESEFGRTTDPVRMYMREMGTVELLTREGEIKLAKRIEEGVRQSIQAIATCPATIAEVVKMMDLIEAEQMRLSDLLMLAGGLRKNAYLKLAELTRRRVDEGVMSTERIKVDLDKALAGDPWEDVPRRFPEGTRHPGIVTRVQPFGAFVELMPGVDGLLHISTLDDPRITDARKAFQQGQELEVEVVSLDPGRQRIGLAPANRALFERDLDERSLFY